MGFPENSPFKRTTNATNSIGTITDTAISIHGYGRLHRHTAVATTSGGNNLAWRFGLNDRPRFQHRPRTRDS